MKPGDIVIVDFAGVRSVKRRPAVAASTGNYHLHRPDMLTSKVARATAPSDYLLQDWAAASLRRPSAFRAFWLTLPASDARLIGHLSDRDWQEIHALALWGNVWSLPSLSFRKRLTGSCTVRVPTLRPHLLVI